MCRLPLMLRNLLVTQKDLFLKQTPETQSSQQDTPANRSVLQEIKRAQKIIATSGRTSSKLLHTKDPLGAFSKMFMVTSGWVSTKSCLTWKLKATPAGRLLFQLAVSMPPKEETDFGLWPTPTANEDACGTPNGKMQKMLGNHPAIRGTTPEEWGSGTLNPQWVEWLMGYPSGWTDLED